MDMSDLQGDETVSLSDVLVARDTCLPEDELWALCRECCLVLEVVNNSPDMFLTLCVTPDTVAFDQVGNVCFLDLDVEPEPIYLPPEYSNQGNTYKAHLFSLGMTLLYAAEYNVTDTKEAISTELRDILGRMTADDPASRPDLESTIILCEEQLFGQSSQEVCCGIAAVVGFGLPDEELVENLYWKGGNLSNIRGVANYSPPGHVLNTDIVNEGSVLESFVTDTGGSPDDFSHAESYVQSDYGDTTCCDDIPDLTEDISQAESLPSSEQETVVVTEETTESHDDSLLSEEHDNDLKQKSSSSTLKDTSDVSVMQNLVEQNTDTMKDSISNKPAIPKKPDIKQKESDGAKYAVVNGVKQLSGELTVSELFSESESDQSRVDSDKQIVNGKTQNSSNSSSTNSNSEHSRKRERSKDKRSSGSGSSKKETTRDSNQNITYMKHEEKTTDDKTNSDKSVNKDMVLEMNENGILIDSLEPSLESGTTKTKKNKRKQGLTISDILEALDRNLTEPELWALCKEGTMALQRKKKHLPAYLSPDTLVVRESGNLSFKAIPEEKPLEVIFMAPELQKKGELSEKTCLFGLSVTLRCAAGKKYSSVSAMNVSSELKDLLQYLADSNPVRRPELVDIAKICNEHNNGSSSDGICSKLFLEAFKVMNEKEEKAKQSTTTESVVKPAPLSAFKPAGGSSLIKPVSGPAFQPPGGSSFQPVKPAPIGGSSCAFAPVPKKKSPNTDPAAEPRIPSAFSSPATHFKPIILQQTQTPINENSKQTSSSTEKEKSTSSKDKPKQSPKQTTVASPKKSSPDPNADKEKEVVKKLKELKKNLMKHKQPSMAKEIENEDKASDISSHSKSSSSNKKSLPTTPKKSGSQSGERSRKRKGSTGALDALLKEIQKQGNAPDTQSLASAIAGFLQNHLNQSDSTPKSETQSKPVSDLDMTVTSAQSSLGQGQMLPDLNIPSQYHSQLVGQTMTLPPGIQYGSNVYSGLPQFQFQPDPVTGYLQLVPVNVVPMRPQSVHSNSGSAHSVRDFTSPTGSGNIKDLNSPDMSPKTLHNQSDNQSAISDQSGSRGKIPHGRTAKDLVQKTANLRAKNLGRPSPSNLQAMTREPGNMQKWKSDHTLDRSEHQFYSDSERFSKHGSYSSLSYSNKLSTAFVYDDSVLNSARSGPGPVPRPHSQYGPITSHHMRSPEDMHRHNLNSTTSSPSPSTHDSGIGGMNHGIYRGPGSDASLMERLLNSNANVRQQKILGKIVHLLREEFAFDGYMENGVEDLAMAEYICSIGVLKWETFKSAISEKYNDLYWHDEVLHNLYAAVNGGRPSSANRSTSGQSRGPTSQRQRQAGHHDDDSSGHSERDSHRKKSHERLKPNFSPAGQGIADKGNNHLDTSDSTDTENYSKRRRIKTKHELDKRKSSSNSNILVENLQPLVGSVNNNSVTNKPLTNLAANSLNVSVSNTSSLPRNTNRQSAQIDIGQHSNFNSLPKQPVSSISPGAMASKPPKPQTDASVSPHVTKPNQNKSTINGLSPSSQTSTENVSQGLSREMSMSSHSSSQSDLIREGDTLPVEKRGHVVYHWAMIQLCQSNEIEKFMQGIDEQNRKLLVTKLAALSQEIKMEKRSRRKTQKFYKCLVDNNKSVLDVSKNDKTTKEKNQVLQVAKDITEMTRRIGFVDLCKTHLQMLLAELHGIDVSYLYSISVGPKDEPLQLHPKPENPLLQFQTLREPQTGYEIQALHAGTPDGLMAYLFASTALSDGFIHQFLYCYRYFTTATDVLNFLIDKYASATKSGSTETNISRLQERVVDLLHYWLEGYFSIDFKGKQRLIDTLRNFIRNYIQDDTEGGQSLLSLLSTCCSGSNLELSSADPDDAEMHFWQTSEPKVKTSQTEKKKEWESFKSLVRGKSNAKEKSGKVTISAVCVERRRRSTENPDVFPSRGRRTDLFMLADYTAQCLAEQLCLIEQGIFQLTHPVHYLDSKSRGVGVALTMKGMKTPAMSRRSGGEECHGLFVEPLQDSLPIQKMIDHAQEVSHWVAGEIVACSNSKTQVAVLSKFLFIAHACIELRNFATSMAILDGLENLIIKQLPAWKNLPSKCSALMEELTKVRMFLKNDPLSLMQQGKECHLYPTIPSSVIFLLHVQQLEIGGFKLANQMFKWGKIRSICQVIDQIRVYREHMYGFEADHNLQDTLRQRIHEMSEQDIHDLAVQHDMNYQKMSSGSGISGAFKKMKGKFK